MCCLHQIKILFQFRICFTIYRFEYKVSWISWKKSLKMFCLHFVYIFQEDLIICEYCDQGVHYSCLTPPPEKRPKVWDCDDCLIARGKPPNNNVKKRTNVGLFGPPALAPHDGAEEKAPSLSRWNSESILTLFFTRFFWKIEGVFCLQENFSGLEKVVKLKSYVTKLCLLWSIWRLFCFSDLFVVLKMKSNITNCQIHKYHQMYLIVFVKFKTKIVAFIEDEN